MKLQGFGKCSHLVHGLRVNMKNRLMSLWGEIMLRKRCITECINDLQKHKVKISSFGTASLAFASGVSGALFHPSVSLVVRLFGARLSDAFARGLLSALFFASRWGEGVFLVWAHGGMGLGSPCTGRLMLILPCNFVLYLTKAFGETETKKCLGMISSQQFIHVFRVKRSVCKDSVFTFSAPFLPCFFTFSGLFGLCFSHFPLDGVADWCNDTPPSVQTRWAGRIDLCLVRLLIVLEYDC